ncbi:MAG: transposase domain-containing protein [SAR324 cluster bacterium]|nr:transposase domain-containing protein [SAR324 cluster bacterium]
MIETAKANGWEPNLYLNSLFERLPHAKNDEQLKKFCLII